jgi:hypothetical protein
MHIHAGGAWLRMFLSGDKCGALLALGGGGRGGGRTGALVLQGGMGPGGAHTAGRGSRLLHIHHLHLPQFLRYAPTHSFLLLSLPPLNACAVLLLTRPAGCCHPSPHPPPPQDIDAGKLWPGKPAPAFARAYWRLPEDATMRDLILVVRADEACHSHVNHTFSGMKGHEANPFGVGSHQVP